MSWINELAADLLTRYQIDAEVKENLALKFGKWQHRVTMDLSLEAEEDDDVYPQLDVFGRPRKPYKRCLRASGVAAIYKNRGVTAHWRAGSDAQMFVYTNNLEELLTILSYDHRLRVKVIEYMRPETATSYAAGPTSQYKTSLTVKKNLPYGLYRYKIHVVTNKKTRTSIGKKNLAAVISQLDNYEVHLPVTFRERAELFVAHSDNYFYSVDLEWLTIISIIDPRWVKHIEEIKTLEEVQNEQPDPNTAGAQPNP